MQVQSEDDGAGGHKEPRDHSLRIAVIGCIVGSASLKKNHEMAPPYINKLFGIETQTALTERNKQNQASGFFPNSMKTPHRVILSAGVYDWSCDMVK